MALEWNQTPMTPQCRIRSNAIEWTNEAFSSERCGSGYKFIGSGYKFIGSGYKFIGSGYKFIGRGYEFIGGGYKLLVVY